MTKVQFDDPIWGLELNQYVCFCFVAMRPFLAEIKQISYLALTKGHDESQPKSR